MAWQCMSSEA